MLLCELHAHTTWSDGELTVTELVDLYGMHGFDVLCVTDHLLRSEERSIRLRPDTYPHYVKTIERESRRAREQYGLLLIPGAELTHVAADPDEAGHALAVGLRSFCSVDEGLEPALRSARASGAAIIAAHPHGGKDDPHPDRTTRWFWRNHERLDGVVDRYELAEPTADLWLGRRGRPPGDRDRRLPPRGASRELEDAAALREERARGGRLPPLGAPCICHAVGALGRGRRPSRGIAR
jgi:hypothetical protein